MDIFKLKVDRKHLNAYLTVVSSEEMEDVDMDMARKYLDEAGIVYGLDEDALREMIVEKRWDTETKVASGLEPVPGEDGFVDFHFKPEIDFVPEVKEDGSVDFHDLNITQNVVKGQHLAVLMPPTEGRAGKNVYGETIQPREGKPARLVSGENTSFVGEKSNILQADIDGHVKLKFGYLVEVDSVFYVKGNIDYSTGDLDVVGDVVVKGDVLSGFKIKATGNVDIRGTVEDSTIEADGNVLVAGGFVGSGKGWIRAGGNVIIKFVHNQNISAKADIFVAEESLHANLEADNSIIMNKGKGVLIGGRAKAEKSMEIKYIGNEQHIRTSVVVAENSELSSEIDHLKSEISIVDEKLDKLMHKILSVMDQVYWNGWTTQNRKVYNTYENRAAELYRQINNVMERIYEYEQEICNSGKDAFIKILKGIHPGARIWIAGVLSKIDDETGPAVFRLSYDEVVIDK